MILLALWGCLDALLEAPFILTAGLAPVNSLSPSPDSHFFAATDAGVVHILGDGQHALLDPAPAEAVSAHAGRLYALHGGELRWTPLPLAEPVVWTRRPAPPGTHDLQAWCEDSVVLATDGGLLRWTPADDQITAMAWGKGPVARIAVSVTAPCDELLVISGDSVQRRSASGSVVLASAVAAPQSLATASDGSVWVVHGADPVLSVLEGGQLSTRARHLGDVRDVWFGSGVGLWSRGNAYFASGEGRIDYAGVRQP